MDIYGTGGSLLEDLKKVLASLTGLKRLDLTDFQLENVDGIESTLKV